MNNKEFGQFAENHAAKFLQKLGYLIVDRNVRTHLGEIDIIARDKEELVFVEVKALKDAKDFDPMDHMTHSKQKKLVQLVQQYTSDMVGDLDQRIDVILVYDFEGTITIDHYKDVISA